MLHPDKIRKAIDRIQIKKGIKLVEYQMDKCAKVYEHFQSITTTDGKKKFYCRPGEKPEDFKMEKWESDWIRNELLMCGCSFEYWFYRYFFLKDWSGYIRRPDRTIAHQMALDIFREIDGQNRPIVAMFQKARQLGVSTLIEAIIIWIFLFRKGSTCVISSAEEDKSIKLSEMVWRCLDNLPIWMEPPLSGTDRSRGPEWDARDSAISIQHGSMKKGIGRGETPVAAHLSECAWYPDPVGTMESAIFRAMHENPRSFQVLESTARKKGDWWHKTWLYNRESESEGKNKYVCIFLPWYVGTDLYPTKDWIVNHPIPLGWKPSENTKKQAINSALYVNSTPLLMKYMGKGWKMPREQQWYYEFEYEQAARSDETLKSFMAEMCSDEREGFQSKRWSVYSQEVLDRIESGLADKWVDYAVTGSGISPRFSMKDYQSPSAKRIPIVATDINGNLLEWKLIPLKETPVDEEFQFYMRVWETPRPGYRYTVAVDISGGVGLDATVIDVLRIGKDYEPDVQVAQLYSKYISSPEVPPFVHAIGLWYGQHMSPVAEALVCPETQVATGDPTSFQLSEAGYTNFFYMDRYDMRRSPGHKAQRRGWATNAWSRPLMLETLKMSVDYGWVVINSVITHEELANQEADETDSGRTKYDHADGEHDDTIFSLGIAIFCSHDKETLAARKIGKRPRVKVEREEPQVETDSTETMLSRHFAREDSTEWGYSSEEEQIPSVF
jgi:hypothetical protein